jgi:hypothetical protein
MLTRTLPVVNSTRVSMLSIAGRFNAVDLNGLSWIAFGDELEQPRGFRLRRTLWGHLGEEDA